MRQGLVNLPFFSIYLNQADNITSNINKPMLTPTDNLLQSGKETAR